MHLEHDAVAAVVGNVYMKKTSRFAGDEAEIEFAQPVGCFKQFSEMYIPGGRKIHSVEFGWITSKHRASIV